VPGGDEIQIELPPVLRLPLGLLTMTRVRLSGVSAALITFSRNRSGAPPAAETDHKSLLGPNVQKKTRLELRDQKGA
jgi:hypothetical protein